MNRVDQNQVIAGRGKVSTLEDAADLTVPDGVSLPQTFTMAQSTHSCLWFVLDTLLGSNYPSSHSMDTFVKDFTKGEMNLEE